MTSSYCHFGASLVLLVLISAALAQERSTAGSDADAESDTAPTGSLLAKSLADDQRARTGGEDAHALRARSMFAVAPTKPREFKPHDLVEIIVRETSRVESTQETETKKEYELDGKVSAWPDLSLRDLLNFQAYAGRSTGLPTVGVDVKKEFEGEGDYKREDDFTARITAEVIEVLPNGNLVLEARTFIKTDEEESAIKVTGVCRPADVTPANTVLSNKIHDLKVVKEHKGQLKESNEKGLLAKLFDTIFAF